METKLPNTPSFVPKPSLPASESRGAGGKFRKPSSRRPTSTPYSRPPQPQPNAGGGSRWFTKLVDPAYKLISGGANLIFPAFFAKSESLNALPAPSDVNEEIHDDSLQRETVEQSQNVSDGKNALVLKGFELRENGVGTSKTKADGSSNNTNIEFTRRKENNQNVVGISDSNDNNEFTKIEQLLKNKQFSRDEINSIVKLLNSQAVDAPDVEEPNKFLGKAVGDSQKLSEAKTDGASLSIPEASEREDLCAISKNSGNPLHADGNSRKSIEQKIEDLDRVSQKVSTTPLRRTKLEDDVGNSPIEIARAYMENRASEVGFGGNSLMSRDEGTLLHGNELALRSYIQSPALKSTPRWPGASLEEQRGYMTPHSQRGRFGLRDFPRTPYSRSNYTKTKSRSIQLQGNSDRSPSMISSPFRQTQFPRFGQINSRANELNDGHGSVGPIRRVRHKAVEETPRGSSIVSKGFLSAPRTNLDSGGTSGVKFHSIGDKPQSFESSTPQSSGVSFLGSKPQSSEVHFPTVPAHSSEVAKKILEHLERNPPTPKDKSVELRLATSWKKTQSSDLPIFMPNKPNRLTNVGILNSSEKSAQVRYNGYQGSANASTSGTKVGTTSTHDDYSMPSLDKPQDSKLLDAPKDVSKIVANSSSSEVFNFQKLPPQPSSTKRALPSIAINKPDPRWNFSSDNGLGFSFPVSTASGGSSEPPTPSFIPPSAVISQPEKTEGTSSQRQLNDGTLNKVQQSEGSSVPTYTFGSRRSTPPLVFSFPSTSSSAKLDDTSDLKFKFGSDETPRLSFSSVGKNAICY